MRSLVIFESIFGNTREVAEAMAKELEDYGPVVLTEVASAPKQTSEFDLVLLGGPIHAWAMSRPQTREDARRQAVAHGKEPVSKDIGVREWLDSLEVADGFRAAAAFDTAVHTPAWLPQGSAAKPEAKRLKQKGFHLVAPPEHFFVEDTEGPVSPGELGRARTWAHWLAEAVKGELSEHVSRNT